MADHVPSERQQAIYDWIEAGSGHAVVQATAGSGKTTTIMEACARVLSVEPEAAILYLVFNKDMQVAAQKRFAAAGLRVDVRTIHAQGLQHLKAAGYRQQWGEERQERKLTRLSREALREVIPEACWYGPWALRHDLPTDAPPLARVIHEACGGSVGAVVRDLRAAVEAAMIGCVDARSADYGDRLARLPQMRQAPLGRALFTTEAWLDHREELRALLDDLVQRVQVACWHDMQRTPSAAQMEFCEMAYWPGMLSLPAPRRYGWVMVDEAQDLSPVMLRLLGVLVHPPGPIARSAPRLLAVGDPRQAIYGFAGADRHAFERLISEYRATVLPLDVTYRCPRAVVEVCRRIAPEMQAAPAAREGVVRRFEDDEALREVAAGDLVLCRMRSPLLSWGVKLLAQGRPAAIKGRAGALAQEVLFFVGEAVKRTGCPDVVDASYMHAERSVRALIEADPTLTEESDECAALLDLAACVVALCTLASARTVEGVEGVLRQLTTTRKRRVISLSTVHRAKGLEADRVWILRPGELPKGEAPSEQELCVAFVAASRARRELCVVGPLRGASWLWDPPAASAASASA